MKKTDSFILILVTYYDSLWGKISFGFEEPQGLLDFKVQKTVSNLKKWQS